MKVLICGSRSISVPELVSKAISRSGMSPTHIISGGARESIRLLVYLLSQEASNSRNTSPTGAGTGNVPGLCATV
jgi:hypothetical protein